MTPALCTTRSGVPRADHDSQRGHSPPAPPAPAPKPPPAKKPRKADSAPARAKTQAQIDRRRDRNRILARRVLEKEVLLRKFATASDRSRTGERLAQRVSKNDASLAGRRRASVGYLYDCLTSCGHGEQETGHGSAECVRFHADANITIGPALLLHHGPFLEDNPIVYASKSFLDTTGYTIDEVISEELPIPARAGDGPESRARAEQGH